MEFSEDQDFALPPTLHSEMTPLPDRVRGLWRAKLEKLMGDDPEERWGSRLIRVASDMIVVCDEELNIRFHNRAFLRGIGYQSGTFTGHSLMEFFPLADQADAERAFDGLKDGPQAGLRINATFLTANGDRQFDARVTRSRCTNGGMYLYLVARESLKQEVHQPGRIEAAPIDPILNGLPVAAFRTDRKLRVTHVCGSLWDDMGFDAKSFIGGDLSDSHCHLTPPFLHEMDFCDTMAGLTMHSNLAWKEDSFEITVEPFVNKSLKVIGTVGMIRKAKRAAEEVGIEHLQFPSPQDYTQALKPMSAYHKTRKIEIGPPHSEPEQAKVAASEEAHRNIPATITNPLQPAFPAPLPFVADEPATTEVEEVLAPAIEFSSPAAEREKKVVEPMCEEEVFEELSVSGKGDFEVPALTNSREIEIGPPTMVTAPIPAIATPANVREIEIGPPAPQREPVESVAEVELTPFESVEMVELQASDGGDDIEVLRSRIQPRRLAPSDVLNGSDEGGAADDPIVLAN